MIKKFAKFFVVPLFAIVLLLTACPAPASDDDPIDQAAPTDDGEEDNDD